MEDRNGSEIRRLILAKKLYLHGCAHAFYNDDVSKMLAIHHFDNAIEMVLKCIATKRGIQPKARDFDFEDLLARVDNLPLKDQLRGLHKIRNIVQHQGDIPSAESVIKYKGYTGDFFGEVCSKVFNIPYEELFLCQLVQNENLKERLLRAEESFGRREFKQCIALCDDTLISAVFDEADIFYVAGMLTGYWGASDELRMVLNKEYPEKYREKDYYGLARELQRAILQLGQSIAGMQFLGEHRIDFLKHRQMVETLQNTSEEDLKDNAEFSLNFVTSLILKWQGEGVFRENRRA